MARLYLLPFNLRVVFFFNVVATTLWFCCLGRLFILLLLVGRQFLPGGIAEFFQTLSVSQLLGLAIVKSALGKNISRKDLWSILGAIKPLWICFGVIFPHAPIAKHTYYSLLIVSWSIGYIIHFGYYAFKTKTGGSPYWLFWLKYHHFYFTFPSSFISEMALTFLSLGYAQEESLLQIVIMGQLLVYIPIGYFAWGYLKNYKIKRFNEITQKRDRNEQNLSGGHNIDKCGTSSTAFIRKGNGSREGVDN